MRVYLKKNITAYSGKDGEEDVVYSAHNMGNICIAKNYTKPAITAHMLEMKANCDTISTIWNQASVGYKADILTYAKAMVNTASDCKISGNKYSWFVKLLYAYTKAEGVSFSTLTITTVRASSIKNIQGAIENGFIPDPGLTTSLSAEI